MADERIEGDYIEINKALRPLAWLYGIGVGVRNFLYDINIKKARQFPIPVICVGNITVGGAGKTPHVEYLIRLLKNTYKVAVLSRGYKRQSKGFQLAGSNTKMKEIGDEPYQMHKKFPEVNIAVDKDRCHGVEQLLSMQQTKDTQVVLLDDAYQHRHIKPSLSILLVDYHRLIMYDELLPAGRLREPIKGKDRATIVIVTKCPRDLKPMEYRVLQKQMNLYPYQTLFFSTLKYCRLTPLFQEVKNTTLQNLNEANILVITGIASPEHLMKDLMPHCKNAELMRFADHHMYSKADAEAINAMWKSKKHDIIITTEKDATRLLPHQDIFIEKVRQRLFYLPIQIEILQEEGDKFNSLILEHIQNFEG